MVIPFPLVILNLAIFGGLGWYAFSVSRKAPTASIRMLWQLAVLPVVAVLLGGLQRLAVQAVRVGLLPEETLDFLLEGWQVAQSVVVAAIGVYTFLRMRHLAARLFDVEIVVGEMVDRVRGVNLDSLELTAREREVLGVIGGSAHIDDRTLAEKLGVSPDTVHSHVSSLLKKSKLSDRRDLIVVALLLKTQKEDFFIREGKDLT